MDDLLLVRFEVGEDADKLEEAVGEELGLVDDDDRLLSGPILLEKKILEVLEQLLPVVGVGGYVELLQDLPDELLFVHDRVQDERVVVGRVVEPLEEDPGKGGLP